MMIDNLLDLVKDEKIDYYQEKTKDIDSKINGRVCKNEYLELLPVIKDRVLGEDCSVYLEIGVLHGGSMLLMAHSDHSCSYYGIDIFSYYGKEYDPHTHQKVKVSKENTLKNIKKFSFHEEDSFKLIKGDSSKKETKELLLNHVNEVDFLFIDGDHSYQGVSSDIELYSPLLSSGGILAFDNYTDPDWPEVQLAFDEFIKNNHRYEVLFQYSYLIVLQKREEEK